MDEWLAIVRASIVPGTERATAAWWPRHCKVGSDGAGAVTGVPAIVQSRWGARPTPEGGRAHLSCTDYDVLIDAEATVLKDSSAWGSLTTTR